MPAGLDGLKHIVVLMMENRSFDHMLGALRAQDATIDGLTGNEWNPDTTGAKVPVQPLADYQSQLLPDPGHHYPDVNTQLYFGSTTNPPAVTMQGFVQSYFTQEHNVDHSHKIMYYFTPDKLPVITKLAKEYAVFNCWFSSIPGPTLCNRAFAHFGTSFGRTDMTPNYLNEKYKSIYERMIAANHTAKVYYYDQQSSTLALAFLLKSQPKLFGLYEQFLDDCSKGMLPEYSFIEPNYTDHDSDAGEYIASDQHPDHNVKEGETFIATVYNAIRRSPAWESTALLIVYDEHGGLYDHVPPPACTPDDSVDKTTGFKFDRLGIRVPAILVSPWVDAGTRVNRVFEHASIPATVTKHFLGDYEQRSPREKAADTFLDVLSRPTARTDYFAFDTGDRAFAPRARFGQQVEIVPIPKSDPASSNKNRPISLLIREQVEHLHDVELTLPPEEQTGINTSAITTEIEAARYIAAVTSRLHPEAATTPPPTPQSSPQ
jgi:phospholipase C